MSGSISGQSDFVLAVVEQGASQVTFYSGTTGERLRTTPVGFNPHEITADPLGERVYVTNFGVEDYDNTLGRPGWSTSVISVASGSQQGQLLTFFPESADTNTVGILRAPHGIKLRPPDFAEIFVNAEVGNQMLVYDESSGEILRTFPVPAGTHNFVFAPDGQALYALAGPNGVYSLDPADGSQRAHYASTTPIRGLTWTADQRKLIASGMDELVFLNPTNLTVDQRFAGLACGQIIYSAATPNGQYVLAPATFANQVLVINVPTGEVIHRLSTGKAPLIIAFAPDGQLAFVTNALDDHVSVIDLRTWEVKRFAQANHPNGIVVIPKSRE